MKELIERYLIKQDIFYECMLLEYYYSESNQTFTWVGRPGLFTDMGLVKNPFLKICFNGVNKYSHVFNAYKNSYINCNNYFLTQNYQGTYESHKSYLKKNLELYEIESEMTFLLGSIFFEFDTFFLEVLNTESVKLNDSTFIYLNPETKEEINFIKDSVNKYIGKMMNPEKQKITYKENLKCSNVNDLKLMFKNALLFFSRCLSIIVILLAFFHLVFVFK